MIGSLPRADDDSPSGWRPPATITPAQERGCIEAVNQLDDALAGGPIRPIAARIAVLLAHYYAADLPAAVQEAMATDWLEDLQEFPAWAVDEAARVWRRSNTAKPKISDIRRLAMRATHEQRVIRGRLDWTLRRSAVAHIASRGQREAPPAPNLRLVRDPSDGSTTGDAA